MAPNSCLCNASFGTKTSLRNHAVQHSHSLRCECGEFFASKTTLQDHQNAPRGSCKSRPSKQLEIDFTHQGKNAKNHFWCGVCVRKYFPTEAHRTTHLRIFHHACPTCLQVFTNSAARQAHQKSTRHCFCPDCDEDGKTFSALEALAHHQCTVFEADKYECLTCGANFSNDAAFVNHFNSQGHDPVGNERVKKDQQAAFAAFQLAKVEESNLWCEECKKHFVDNTAYDQHKSSSKHKAPRFTVKCDCGKVFNLVSALVQHLESGGCDSGATRHRLNATIYRHDMDRRITMARHADRFAGASITESSGASVATSDSASTLVFCVRKLSLDSSRASMIRDRIFTPDDSDATSTISSQDGVILTPDGSDHTSTDSESINTSPASETSSALSDGGAALAPFARGVASPSSSDSESVFTPTSSTIGDRITPAVGAQNSESVSEEGEEDLTPAGSFANDASGEWSFINSSTAYTPSATSIDGSSVATIRYDTASKCWPCVDCPRTFTTKTDLRQHMESAVHAQKIFHCPTSVPGNGANTPIRDREFSTISGLVQHAESEACKTGTDAMKSVMGVIEKPMSKKFRTTITSLKK